MRIDEISYGALVAALSEKMSAVAIEPALGPGGETLHQMIRCEDRHGATLWAHVLTLKDEGGRVNGGIAEDTALVRAYMPLHPVLRTVTGAAATFANAINKRMLFGRAAIVEDAQAGATDAPPLEVVFEMPLHKRISAETQGALFAAYMEEVSLVFGSTLSAATVSGVLQELGMMAVSLDLEALSRAPRGRAKPH